MAKAKKATGKRAAARRVASKKAVAEARPRKVAAKKPATRGKAAPKPPVEPEAERIEQLAGVGNETIAERTGKRWEEWLAILDDKAAIELPHSAIARWLHNAHGLDGWWAQTVAVGYEQARGLREQHEKLSGFEISKSRTLAATPEACFTAFSNGKQRKRWLTGAAALEVRTAQKPTSIRFSWGDRGSWFEARFYSKREGRTVVTIQHGRLSSSAEARHMQSWWGEALERLAVVVAG